MPLVGIDDIAPPEFQQDLARDIAVRLLDEANFVLPFGREAFGSGTEGRCHDLADIARNAGLEAFDETLDPVPAGTVREGVEPVIKGPVVEGNVHNLGETVDDAVNLGKRGVTLEGLGMC